MKVFDFIFYNFIKLLLRLFFKIFYKVKINNARVLPQNSPVILVGNHSSWFDTLLPSIATFRRIWFLTGDFILDVPVMRDIVAHLYIIPMRKSHGKTAINQAVAKLNDDKMVCIFPEGEVTPTGAMQRFRKGVAIIQKQSKAPIIPFYIAGASDVWSIVQPRWKFFKKMSITFGEPFYPTKETDTDIAQEIQDKVVQLKNNI